MIPEVPDSQQKKPFRFAYAKRKSNLPTPGQLTESFDEAKKFVDNFEIKAIEIIANSQGIVDFTIGHPSETVSSTKTPVFLMDCGNLGMIPSK